jgi:hypothetical protein
VKQTLLAERWRAGKTTLLRAAGPPPRPSRAAQIADAALGIVMAAATLNYTLKGGDAPIGPKPLPPIPGFVPETLPSTGNVGPLQVILAMASGWRWLSDAASAGHILGGTRRDVAAWGVRTQTARYLHSRPA